MSKTQTDMLTLLKSTRDNERTRDILLYETVIETSRNKNSVAIAKTKLNEIHSNIAFETSVEKLVKAEKYDDVHVIRSFSAVNIIISHDTKINAAQTDKIISILKSIQPDLDMQNVNISVYGVPQNTNKY